MDIKAIMLLIPAMIMFCCGVYGFITRRNMIAILISLELMLNAVDINFAVFNRYLWPDAMEGMFFTLFAIAIIINLYRSARNIDVRDLNKLKY